MVLWQVCKVGSYIEVLCLSASSFLKKINKQINRHWIRRAFFVRLREIPFLRSGVEICKQHSQRTRTSIKRHSGWRKNYSLQWTVAKRFSLGAFFSCGKKKFSEQTVVTIFWSVFRFWRERSSILFILLTKAELIMDRFHCHAITKNNRK